MKTIKTFYVTFAFIFLGLVPILAMGQSMPHTFTANTAAKASEVNANFKHLQDQFSLNKKEIDCSTDNLTQKINQGYNHLVIDGNCSVKNLFMGLFDISPYCGHSQANNKIQRLMISGKTGKSSDTLTVNGSANCDSQIGVFHGATLWVSDITINLSGSIMANHSGNIRMRNVIVAGGSSDPEIIASRVGHIQLENFTTTTHGFGAGSGSNIEADNVSILYLDVQRNSSANIKNSTINCSAKDINCVKVESMSSISFVNSTITGGANEAIVLHSNSLVDLEDSTVNSTKTSHIKVWGPYSVLNADSNTTINSDNATVTCGNDARAWKDGTNLCP